MALEESKLTGFAQALWDAERDRQPVPPLTQQEDTLSIEDAYAIQLLNVNRRLRESEALVGYKVGLTSREAQAQFQITDPDFGHLFAKMELKEGEIGDTQNLIQPKIEGEIAFVLGQDLKGPGLGANEVAAAIDHVVGAIEIVDSRIEKWQIKAADTIADNGSSARFVRGKTKRRLSDLDLPLIGMVMRKRDEILASGAGAAVMGNPLEAVAFLVNALGKKDIGLRAGETILSGSLTGMANVSQGDEFSCEFYKLGRVTAKF